MIVTCVSKGYTGTINKGKLRMYMIKQYKRGLSCTPAKSICGRRLVPNPVYKRG